MPTRDAILITGAARRVGRVMALHLAAAGFDIALHYNTSVADAQETAEEVKKLGVACELFACDLRQTTQLALMVADVRKAFPRCNMLVNNASVFDRGAFLETNEALFDQQMDVNFKAPFFLTQAFVKAAGAASIVNVLDTAIKQHTHSYFAYLLSKKALHDFTLMAAAELGPAVRVNAVCPDIMLPSNEFTAEYMQKRAAKMPLKKMGSAEDLSATTLHLLTNPSLTGQVMYVNGGAHLVGATHAG